MKAELKSLKRFNRKLIKRKQDLRSFQVDQHVREREREREREILLLLHALRYVLSTFEFPSMCVLPWLIRFHKNSNQLCLTVLASLVKDRTICHDVKSTKFFPILYNFDCKWEETGDERFFKSLVSLLSKLRKCQVFLIKHHSRATLCIVIFKV